MTFHQLIFASLVYLLAIALFAGITKFFPADSGVGKLATHGLKILLAGIPYLWGKKE